MRQNVLSFPCIGTRVACRLPRVAHYNENTEERENGKGPSIVRTLRALHRDDNETERDRIYIEWGGSSGGKTKRRKRDGARRRRHALPFYRVSPRRFSVSVTIIERLGWHLRGILPTLYIILRGRKRERRGARGSMSPDAACDPFSTPDTGDEGRGSRETCRENERIDDDKKRLSSTL